MQSIMEKLPKLPDKKKLVAGAAVVVLAAAAGSFTAVLCISHRRQNYIPIVRTMTIGQKHLPIPPPYIPARCADVMKASWPSRLPAESTSQSCQT